MKTSIRNFRNSLLIVLSLCMLLVSISVTPVNAATKNDFISSFSVSKKTLYDANGVSISLNSAKKTSKGVNITFVIKNDSKKSYNISARAYAINKLMASDIKNKIDVDVPMGYTKKLTITIDKSWFKDNGIKTFKKFDIIFDANIGNLPDWDSGQLSFSTNKDDKKGYYKPSKSALASDAYLRAGYLSKKDSTYKFFLQNKTDICRNWKVENCTINSLEFASYPSRPILGGCYAVLDLTVDKDYKTKNEIKSVKEISFNIRFEPGTDSHGNHMDDVTSRKIVQKFK